MSSDSPQDRLADLAARSRERAAELAAELERRRGLPPGPGDLFTLPATAELPVEWAILARRPGPGGELLAVPADSRPLAGGADVEVPAGAPGGPLVLRCGCGLWLPTATFNQAVRTGVLSPADTAAGLARRGEVEAGTVQAAPLTAEVEMDPEYQDWIEEVPRRARELVAPKAPSQARVTPRRRWRTAEKLAAALAVVALGLSLWVVALRREVAELSESVFDAPTEQLVLGDGSRGETTLPIPRDARWLALPLHLELMVPSATGHLEIVDGAGRTVWRSAQKRFSQARDYLIHLPALPAGTYRLRFVPDRGTDPTAEPLEEVFHVEIER